HDNMVGQSQFNNSRGQFSVAYLKQLSGDKYRTSDQYLIAGGQAGMGQHRMNGSRLWFSEQFDVSTGRPDFGASSGETGDVLDSQSTDLFMDFSAGLLWYALFGDNASIYAGAALHHLNEPEISFFAFGEETLYRRWTAHIGGEVPFSPELSLLPAIAVIGQGPSRSTSVGANIRYSNNDWYEVAIRAGVWTHFARQGESDSHMDALTFTGILEMENWNLGLSYDINTSNLNLATNSRGAFEMSLIYIYPYEGRTKVNCPKF
ncbi:MAG: PorP/SprF family type IX secretion system membrane protein, partial [Bacteroidota bacterium]